MLIESELAAIGLSADALPKQAALADRLAGPFVGTRSIERRSVPVLEASHEFLTV